MQFNNLLQREVPTFVLWEEGLLRHASYSRDVINVPTTATDWPFKMLGQRIYFQA